MIESIYGTSTYQAWNHMLQRCNNLNDVDYSCYGGRGISVCSEWRTFSGFFKDVGVVPKGLSLDRIDNDGNYELSNCRWATYSEQNRNRRMFRNNKTGITGVHWSKEAKKFRVTIHVEGEYISLGFFTELQDAANVRKQAEYKYWK